IIRSPDRHIDRFRMFVDEVDVHVEAGHGGAGCLAFRREKFVPRGGPSGGDGDDLELAVPIGTLVYEKTSDPEHPLNLIADLATEGQRVLIAKGGRGGMGNARFASSTNRAPRKTQPGESGEIKDLRFELKLLADVGLVGFPN